MLLLAALAPPGRPDALLEAARLAYGLRASVLRVVERGYSFHSSATMTPSTVEEPSSGGALSLCSGWASTLLTLFLKSGEPAIVHVCTGYRLGREALLTGNPPEPGRRVPWAVLAAYASRLLSEGSSPARLAAKIAARAGGGVSLVAVLRSWRGRVQPEFHLAAYGSKRVCVSYLEGGALAYAPGEDGCMRDIVVTLKLVDGIARVEARELDRVLYG